MGSLTNLWLLLLSENALSGCVPQGLRDVPANDFPDLDLPFCGPPTVVSDRMDRTVLVALYNATDGPNWEDNTNWLSDTPIGEWHGVSVNSNGRVIGLNLFDNSSSGEIPPELGSLTALQALILENNSLSGEIPPELGNLANLIGLFLGDNQLSGEVPPGLGNLPNLGYLYLSGTQLSGEIPPELGSLSNLRYLNLSDNQLSGEIPPELGSLSNLEYLYLGDNQLSGCIPESLRDLRKNDFSELGLPFCTPTN